MKKKILIFALVFCLALGIIACGGSETTTTVPAGTTTTETEATDPAETTQPVDGFDLSEQVHIFGYVPGDPQPDDTTFMEEFNAMLVDDINTTIEFRYLNWGEFFDRYPLIMASGEYFDFAYIASWGGFYGHAQRGAYMDITDLVPVYAPDVWNYADPDTWRSTTYKDVIYGIPHDGHDSFNTNGTTYREDLRKKYDVPEINKFEDLEAYMLALKENEPGIVSMNVKDAVNNNIMVRHALYEKTGWVFDYYGVVYQREDPEANLFLKFETPEYREVLELMVKWKDMGFWDSSVMAQSEFVNEVNQHPFGQGMAAFFGLGVGAYNNVLNFIRDYELDWEAGFYFPVSPSGHVNKEPTLNDGVALSALTDHPERTLMAMNLILTDQRYKMLVAYGIEGKHHELDETGFPRLPEGISPDNAPFNFYINPFSWFLYESETMPQGPRNDATEVRDYLRSISDAPTLLGFNFDGSELQTELAALGDVWAEYEIPLTWGFLITDSLQGDIDNLVTAMKAAGVERVMEEMQRQVDQFLAENTN